MGAECCAVQRGAVEGESGLSTIVSPIPVREVIDIHPDARWWRLELLPNEYGNTMMQRCDGDDLSDATWISMEFYDGFDTYLDAGMDSPNVYRVRVSYTAPVDRLDILSVQRPTPCPRWLPMTAPGDAEHPDDVVCTPSRAMVFDDIAEVL